MGKTLDYLHHFLVDGGPFMYVNCFVLTIALATIFERTLRLFFRYGLNVGPFMNQVTRLVKEGQFDRAIKLCSAAPNAALARVLRAGLSRHNKGEVEVATAMEEAIMEVTPMINKRIAGLWSIANIATLLGLIGTIIGLIGSFASLGAANPQQRQELLSRGISEAMNNTAFGLTIAVTCIVGHLVLTNKSKQMIEEIELNSLKLENLITRHYQGGGEAAPDEAQLGASGTHS